MIAHSYPELRQKLSLLKNKQRKTQNRYLWRSLVVSIFTGSILSIAIFPHWQIKKQSQVAIEGDRFVDLSRIYDTLNIAYPQSIITIPTQQIKKQLVSMPNLKFVEVKKNLFPPSINIYLQERIPVAIAISAKKVGFLDREGVWLDPSLYESSNNELPLTEIQVINFQPEYNKTWSKIYNLITAYPNIEIREVSWDDAGNLSLITQKFTVFLGVNSSLLEDQFATLASFPELDRHQKLQNIAKIDLTNPNSPLIDKVK